MNYIQFIEFVNSELERLGISDFVACKCENIIIKGCICRMRVYFKNKNYPLPEDLDINQKPIFNTYFVCESLKHYKEQIKLGNKLYLNTPTAYLKDATINVI